jgi:hypothetical protein
MIVVDLYDFKKSINIIEQAIEENFFEKNYSAVQQAKELVLNKYQFIAAISGVLDTIYEPMNKKKPDLKIKPKEVFGKPALISKVLNKILRSKPD